MNTDKMALPKLNLITAHRDGTVNLFCLEMSVDDIAMSDISNLVHEVRCSGHRFQFIVLIMSYLITCCKCELRLR